MRHITLTYTVQKIVEVDIADGQLTDDEIQAKIDELLRDNAPDGDIQDDDYSWFGDAPVVKGYELTPPSDFWFEIEGAQWATNGTCLVTKFAPAIGGARAWIDKSQIDIYKADIVSVVEGSSQKPHSGYFDERFLPIKKMGCKVFGDSVTAPGYCYHDDRLVAVIMPIKLTSGNADGLIRFGE